MLFCLSVCLSRVLCQNGSVDLNAVWSGEWVGRGMGVLDGGGIVEAAVLRVNAEHPTVMDGILCVSVGDAALPNLLRDFLCNLWL